MKIAKFLFNLGIIVIIVEVFGVVIAIRSSIPVQFNALYPFLLFVVFISAFFQGGVLIGLSKIIEIMLKQKSDGR